MIKLATIGYEGLSINDLFTILVSNKIEYLIDIRELPLSHKQGFSKHSLANQAISHNIHYFHMRILGCPRDIRNDYRRDGDWEKYTKNFLNYLSYRGEAINQLFDIITTETSCLLCYEANPYRCHRSYVAKAVSQIAIPQIEITHLQAIKIPVVWHEPSVGKLIQQ